MTPTFWIVAAGFGIRILVDGAALERLRARDPQAIRDLVDRHHAALVGLAQTIVRSREMAEDVAQDTWIAVITGLDGFDGRSSLATWIIAILLNKARTAAKRQQRYVPLDLGADGDGDDHAVDPARFSPDGHWIDPPPSFEGADPERIVAGRQIWEHVRAAIDRLPPAQKAVLLLRDVEGRDAAEACSLLGITAENQRILLHRARARLRGLVEDLVRGRPVDPLAKA
jgi:RNA polymerase sigma-70 factor (ECF subfamily)